VLRPQRPQQSTRSVGSTSSPPPTSFEPPETKTVIWRQVEAELQSTPTGDTQYRHNSAAQWFPRSDAPRRKLEEEDCSKHVQNYMHDAKLPGVHDECLAHALEVLCHAQAAEVEAQREAEAAMQLLIKQEQTAGEEDADLIKDGWQEKQPQAFQPKNILVAKPPLDVAFELQQLQEQRQREQQEHQSAEKTEVDQSLVNPTQQSNCEGGQLEMFTKKSKQIQRLQLHCTRTDHDTATIEDGPTVSTPYVGKPTNWRGLPETEEEGAMKHGRTRRAAWAVAAATTAAAAAAAFVLAEAKEGEMKQGSCEDRHLASLAESEASISCGALKADTSAVSACRDSWQANAVERRPRQRPGNRRLRTQASHRHGSLPTQRAQAPAKPALPGPTLLFGCGACLEQQCC